MGSSGRVKTKQKQNSKTTQYTKHASLSLPRIMEAQWRARAQA